MSNENRTRTKEELNDLRAKVIAANPKLNESDIMAAIANGIIEPGRLEGINPYHQTAGSSINYGIEGVPFHDADGVVESTRRGK